MTGVGGLGVQLAPNGCAFVEHLIALPWRSRARDTMCAGPASDVVMMAKKKDRKEGRIKYSGRQPKALGDGLEHRHEKMVSLLLSRSAINQC